MDITKCYKIGYVAKPHGLKGQVTILLDSNAPADAENLDTIFLEIKGTLVPYFVESISVKGDKAYVKFEDIDTIEAAGGIAKSSLYLPLTARAKSGRGQFYDDEIIGFAVNDQTHGHLGSIREVIHAGPNRLLAIGDPDQEILIPVNGPFIVGLNKTKKICTVDLPEGFLDI